MTISCSLPDALQVFLGSPRVAGEGILGRGQILCNVGQSLKPLPVGLQLGEVVHGGGGHLERVLERVEHGEVGEADLVAHEPFVVAKELLKRFVLFVQILDEILPLVLL